MDYITLLGLVAGTLTTLSYVPQLHKAWSTKSTKDLSEVWLVTAAVGFVIWTAYGFLLSSYPLIVSSGVTLVFMLFLIYLKSTHG